MSMIKKSPAVLLALVLGVGLLARPGAVDAQNAPPPIQDLLRKYPAVSFKQEVGDEIGAFTSQSNRVFKPKGDGPFPAVVLVHTCGGIKDSHMRKHGREMLEQGFVVLMQDSYNPRGQEDCGPGNRNAISAVVGANDAYAAHAHLSAYPFVDKNRIYLSGYSFGGFVATMVGSPNIAKWLGTPARFRAMVANYSPCKFLGRDILSRDLDRPLLMLFGEKDDETPPSTCFPVVEEMKAAGKPIKWHLYPGITHGWDKEGQARDGYIYNEETRRDASRRMLEFFKENS